VRLIVSGRGVTWALAALLAACGSGRVPGQVARLDRVIAESSGLVGSGVDPALVWTHGDSGTAPVLFAVDRHGAVVSRLTVVDPPNQRAAPDWEDITRDDAGRLWIADTGNNENRRRDLALFAVREPTARGTAQVPVEAVVRVRYPDQGAWPDPDRLDFDGEALFWWEGSLYILTKHRSDTWTTLYRVPALSGDVGLERLGDYDVGGDRRRFGGQVTGADVSADGATLAVLTYHAVLLFPRPTAGANWLGSTPKVIPLDQDVLRQCEGVAWFEGDLLIDNEDGRVFRLRSPTGYEGVFPRE
jgi:hypothetical protein